MFISNTINSLYNYTLCNYFQVIEMKEGERKGEENVKCDDEDDRETFTFFTHYTFTF